MFNPVDSLTIEMQEWLAHHEREHERVSKLYEQEDPRVIDEELIFDTCINEHLENALCDHPCGQEPMGCDTCDSAFGVRRIVPEEDIIDCGDGCDNCSRDCKIK